jgi:AraC-like DNA-binding protein
LQKTELYFDTGLTIERLAKRMHAPMGSLSVAISQTKGTNVPQYVNGFRLTHAAGLLRESDLSGADIALRSGFLTRSHFYRKFQRSFRQSPVKFRQSALGGSTGISGAKP